ncbi:MULTISPECIES: phage portal protein [Paracoccus]|uniref:Lambda family phage portal protein n=1 Tax=Paracoccus versutus TaxID=34007 RepID=A0A3D9XWZ9_PARVE|nr:MULTISPECIES: phage portal protein [Paracoccus]REF72782.1 lambda family phage portal protein [Paracoccus versutus]WGR55286.1 phage portal protein [Paracoccus versutus]
MAWPFNHLGRFFRATQPDQKRSGIEAGAGGRRWQGAPMLAAPQQSALAARGPAKARAAAQAMNTAYGARIVEAWTAALVGKGWQTRSGHPDPEVRRQLNEAFETLTGPLLPLIARSLVRDGEAFVHTVPTEDGNLRLRVLPADQNDPSLHRDLGNGARIIAGIEFDAQDEVRAYHVLREAPRSPFAVYSDAIRVPASDMLHVFDQLFPGQVRGLSWLVPVLLKLRDRDEASDAMLMSLKVQSLMTGFVSDAEGGAAGFEADAGSVDVSLEPGAMRVLPPGAEVKFSTPGQGLAQAVDFLRAQDREIAAGVGLTFEALTGDLGEANYSSARVGLLDFRRRAEMLQRLLIEGRLLAPLWRRWIEVRALAGVIPADQMEDYLPVRFVPPGWQWVDPRNEVEAETAAINAGLKSRAEVVAARGRDIDELDEEIARDAARAPVAQAKEAQP